jgi:hypothetical protein
MGVLKFHKDLGESEDHAGIVDFVLAQFPEPHLDVTTYQDLADRVESYLVQGPNIPHGILDVIFIDPEQGELPEGYTPFKDRFKDKYIGGWK